MGKDGLDRTDENERCALRLRNHPERRPGDPDAVRRVISAGAKLARFHDPARPR